MAEKRKYLRFKEVNKVALKRIQRSELQFNGRSLFRDITQSLERIIVGRSISRDGTGSRRSASRKPRGSTEREDRRIWRMPVAYRTASEAEIRAAIGTRKTQLTVRNRLLQEQHRVRPPVECITLTPNRFSSFKS
ncbi:allene oxide synthase-lipoxygenase protein [Trichonephila clavipes]|nr:allene oxide synthase-lipoxygenase protein [Trichonephila clavipes]